MVVEAISFCRPISSDTINAQEEVLIGTLLGKVEASDLDENDNLYFEFIDNQSLFILGNGESV